MRCCRCRAAGSRSHITTSLIAVQRTQRAATSTQVHHVQHDLDLSIFARVARPVLVWRDSDTADEVIAQRDMRGEPGLFGDAIHWQPGRFK